MPRNIEITCTDHVIIYAEVYAANDQKEHHTCLIINPAIGVKRRLYQAFAEYLQNHGISVVLYNYRGMEDGMNDLPPDVPCDAESWGRLDQSAVIDWVKNEIKPNKTFVLGHSIGGQLPGFADNINQVDGLVLVAAQKGDYRLWPMVGKFKLFMLWHVFIPWMSRGKFFIAKKLGLGKYPWPATAAKQWANWGRQKDYLFNPKFGFDLSPWHTFNKPLLSLGFTDDDMAPEVAIDGLLEEYGKNNGAINNPSSDNGHIDKRIIHPHNLGLKSIGHFGFFKPEVKSIWQDLVKWIHNN